MKQLWYGGNIYTMEKEGATVEAVLTENEKIIAIGSFQDLKFAADKWNDLQGTSLYPGFVDSHCHLLFYGEKLSRLDLTKAESKADMLDMVRETSQDLPPEAWLIGEGWNETNFTDENIPTIQELDEIRKGPIALIRACRHVVLANTRALEAGGIYPTTPDPPGGKIGRDRYGNLTGLLFEEATLAVTNAFVTSGTDYIESLTNKLTLAIDDMLAKGLTGGHTEDLSYFGHYTNPLMAYHESIGKKKNFRITLLRHHSVFKKMMDQNHSYLEPFIEPGPMKIFADGALGARTAALSKPYVDDPKNTGILYYSEGELADLVRLAREYDETVAVHMIGDRAIEQVLRVLEKYPPPSGKKDRLIHVCVLREDLIEKMAQLPVVVDIQPIFVPSDFPWVIKRLGEDRLKWAYPWKKLLDHGIPCALGTDAPIEDIDPLQNIYAAVERKKPHTNHQGYLPEEKLTKFQAIQLYTIGSAQAIGKDNERGLIKPGYVADFSIFDRDLFAGTTEDILKGRVEKTVVAGRIVYNRNKKA